MKGLHADTLYLIGGLTDVCIHYTAVDALVTVQDAEHARWAAPWRMSPEIQNKAYVKGSVQAALPFSQAV